MKFVYLSPRQTNETPSLTKINEGLPLLQIYHGKHHENYRSHQHTRHTTLHIDGAFICTRNDGLRICPLILGHSRTAGLTNL